MPRCTTPGVQQHRKKTLSAECTPECLSKDKNIRGIYCWDAGCDDRRVLLTKKMSSRRLMNRSLSSDGRSYYGGSDISPQNRRVGCRSYLSSVRSETRSTLCSVMAQLAEEIQPTFETTLKSKAVSEDANVKFSCVVSGHPVPEVTWYKDDLQLDRYCGLPKYEISRDDKTHTLQIYNCTLEDAAIYQASAQNSRGIVSCSGVLEVGTMSEYKIHQNYFAKIKLRNENRRREHEEPRDAGKENVPAALENVRVSSPERAQRKRRSPMETRAAGSPSEEKTMEVDALSPTPPVQESASVHELSNCEMITNKEKDSQGLTYIHDTMQNGSSKQSNEHYVKKKIKISADATERIKESRQTGRSEEVMNESGAFAEKMVTSVTEYENKIDITGREISDKPSVKVNKSASKESKTVSVYESRNKIDITDTKKSEKTAAHTNKSVSEESKRGQGAQITSATESKNKMDITKSKTEKLSERANNMVSEKAKGTQGVQMTSVTESGIKMDITTNKNQKFSVKANKSHSEESKRAQGTQTASATESRNKIGVTVTKTDEKQSVKVNKSHSEESKRAHHTSVTESRNKMDTKDTKNNEQLSEKVNKSVSEESKSVQIASVSESSNNVIVADTKTNEKQPEKVHKSVSEDLKRAQGAQITSVTKSRIKVGIHDTKKNDKQSEKVKESCSESKRVQKLITTEKQLPLNFSMTTQMNKVVENTKLTKSSDKGTSNLQPQTLDAIQNSNSKDIDNKLMYDHRNKPPEGTCVRIFPHSCGGNDVNVDTGERNASACSLRSLSTGDTHTQATEPPICGDVPPFQKEEPMDLKQQPSLMHEVTVSVTETLSSCHLASQGKKLRTGDQSVASTKSSTLVTDPQNTQQSEKISSGHISHILQDNQVTTAMSSSLGNDTLANMCEKDSKAENQLIKESDKLKGETKVASFSKEKSTANSNHSTNHVIVTEFVQFPTTNDVVQPKTMNDSSISNAQIKDNKAEELQNTSLEATNNVAKMDIKAQFNEATSELPKSTHHEIQSYSTKKDHSGSSTFLSQHSNVLPTEFTIPTIYITDVDSKSQNSAESENSDAAEIRTEVNTVTSKVTNNNIIIQVSNISKCTDTMDKTTAVLESKGLSDEKLDLSLHSRPSEVSKPHQQPLTQEKHAVPDIVPHSIRLKDVAMQCHSADKRIKTNESDLSEISHLTKTDLNLKTDSNSFIKQMKLAALDLDTDTTAMKNAAPHKNAKDNFKCSEEVNSAVTEPISCKVTIPSKTTDQIFNSTAAYSEPATKNDQKTTLNRTNTEKSETGVPLCLEKANSDSYQGGNLSLKTQSASPLQSVGNSPLKTHLETHSPRLTRRTVQADLPKPAGNENVKPRSTEKDKENQFKVPQVIRKIRPEVFDASGHLKLWCQFFNIVSDSTIKWYKDEVEIAEIKRSAGDETQVCLAIIQMSKRDCGVYRCTITNEYGKDFTEYLLSTEFLSNMFLREERQEVGEEIEMTPLIFSKGLADAGCWGSKFYGRVTTEEAQVGLGCEHKTRRLKVIYGLDPVFESGSSCFMKVRSPIAYESREDTVLAERNLQITKQECKIQNMAREYFKIFAAETRVIESFGASLEVIPLYFMYLPASSIPHATVEAELKGVYMRYCGLDRTASLVLNEKLEVAQKCSCLQHWIYQWTNGNVLFSRLEGVDTILTNIGIAVRSKGYQGFPCEANPKVFEQFQIQHQCNYFCGLLNLRSLKAPEMLQTSARPKGSSSPLLQRKTAPSSSSPQTPRKATKSPKVSRKLNSQTST
ncbi:alpha-protein kinase 3 isoform X2 [Puntigrus tetrazona]|uniref:alpha-protein kinase 3 isoform X2 n=1 Tax=Puntigrus tetrazona TaxID=1606681 RepID=UPI001C8ACD7A|nr:alpha-protein kinase 3 isoform X2 [Puntigrus tetrazona]